MGNASSSPSSKGPAWYPGEPSPDLCTGHGFCADGGPSSLCTTAESATERRSGGGDTLAQEERISAPTSTHPASSAPPPTMTTGRVTGRTATSTTTTGGAVLVEDDNNGAPEIPSRRNATTTTKRTETKTAAPARAATTSAARGGGPALKTPGIEREITSLPVVELESMKFIAHGAFCAVFACKYRGFSVVAKRVREDLPLPERRKALENLWQEYNCLQHLQHPNVIEAYGMCRVRCREDYDDWNERDVCLLLEQLAFGTVGHLFGTTYSMGKNLKTAMVRSRKMKMVPFRCRLHRALELSQALEYVHGGFGIGSMIHRDIKSMNVGFAQNGCLKLLDFGLSKIVPLDSTEDDTYEMTGEVGSYRYMAPELVKHEPYNVKVDIYSWAILSWEILAIDRPYSDMNESSFVKRVVTGGERPRLHRSWPDRLCKLLASAWHADHTRRPTASEVAAELRAIKSELPAKQQRQHPSVLAPSGAGGGSSSSGGNDGRERQSRRHSWSVECSSPSIATPRTSVTATGSARLRGGRLRLRRRSFSSSSGSMVHEEGSEGGDERAGAAADDGDGHCPRRPHHGSFISRQRRLILDALARETEGIHIGRAKEADRAGIVVAALPPRHG
ncbi:unnamed protein product [Ectocarpus sp. 12 AP-2014]